MEKTPLNKKLKSYSALAGSLALISTQTDAQVIYTDVNPDSTTAIGGSYFNLDLDNGGVFDFAFNLNIGSSSSYTSQQVAVTPAGANGVAGDTVGAYVYPFALNSGDTIKSTLQFNFGSSQSMASYFGSGSSYGNFLGQTNKFIGLQFYIGAQLHYGWARFDVDATASQFTIKDYAYNATPNASILAGEMPLGVEENAALANTTIYSSDKTIFIQFLSDKLIQSDVKVSNAIGQVIFQGNLNDKENKINMAEANSGIYFVTITQNNIVYTKKVYIR